MKIGLACCFRHHPETDGETIIQGSTVEERPDMDEWAKHASPDCPPIFPRIGYLAAYNGKSTRWSFVKYEAPQQWDQKSGFKSKGAYVGTCSVGTVTCQCGWTGYYPLKGGAGETMTCPWCGRKGAEANHVRIPSEEFDAMLGDLRDPLEQAAKAAFDEGTAEFSYPQILLGGPDVVPSGNVPPAIQGKAQVEAHVNLKPLEDVENVFELRKFRRGSVFLAIVPGITSGVMDEEEVRNGRSIVRGACMYWTKVRLPDAPSAGFGFGTCKF